MWRDLARVLDAWSFIGAALYALYSHQTGNTDTALFAAVIALWFKPVPRGDGA